MSDELVALSRPCAVTIDSLQDQLRLQAASIASLQSQLAHSRKIFARASEAARIGVWECDLPDNTLRWTDVVYDIFDLPRGSALDRDAIVKLYGQADAERLHQLRSAAIAGHHGFKLDARIVTARGNERWIRITATVECENGVPVRIFGIKQDITDEKRLADQMKYLAECDVLTGLANRARFQQELTRVESIQNDSQLDRVLLLIDLDNFKIINDSFGHPTGDAFLQEIAQRLREACRPSDLIARIGGDEFAILLGNGVDLAGIQQLAQRIVERLHAPVTLGDMTLDSSISLGAARLGRATTEEWCMRADAALYAAKRAGRNTFRIDQPLPSQPQCVRPLLDRSAVDALDAMT